MSGDRFIGDTEVRLVQLERWMPGCGRSSVIRIRAVLTPKDLSAIFIRNLSLKACHQQGTLCKDDCRALTCSPGHIDRGWWLGQRFRLGQSSSVSDFVHDSGGITPEAEDLHARTDVLAVSIEQVTGAPPLRRSVSSSKYSHLEHSPGTLPQKDHIANASFAPRALDD